MAALPDDPTVGLVRWVRDAIAAADDHAELFLLSTCNAQTPSARLLSVKRVDERGIVFVTDARSPKVRDLTQNPRAAATFTWMKLRRQVTVSGTVRRLPGDEADLFFRSRNRSARLVAWASTQSRPIPDLAELQRAIAALDNRWPRDDSIPVPDHWYAGLLEPSRIEFLQAGRRDRLHERSSYCREAGGWHLELLAP